MLQKSELVKFTLKHLDRLEENLENLRATGEPGAVHGLRVTSRRLNEPLAIMGDWFGRKKIKHVRKGLKQIRQALRTVRDLDVLSESLSEPRSDTALSTADRSRLQDSLAVRRKSELAAAVVTLNSLNPREIMDSLDALSRSFEKRVPQKHGKLLRRRVQKAWRRRAGRMLEKMASQARNVDLHEVRIDLKSLRYCTELKYKLEGAGKDDLLTSFTRMQDCLGAWNDQLFAATMLSQIATEPGVLSVDAGWSARILQLAAQRAQWAAQDRDEVLICWPAVREAIEAALYGDKRPAQILALGEHVPSAV